MLQLSPGLIDRILVRATGICDVGLTQRHLPPALPPPIEVMRNGPTACLRHERFEANHFGADSVRFGLGEDKTVVTSQVIGAAKEAGLIKADESETTSTRYARYLPFWA